MQKICLVICLLVSIKFQAWTQCMLQHIELQEMATNADVIVEGQVMNSYCSWNANHNMIYTIYTLEVHKYFKSTVSDATIKIAVEGGIVDDRMIKVSQDIRLRTGDRGIFLLNNNEDPFNSENQPLYVFQYWNQSIFLHDFIDMKSKGTFESYDLRHHELEEKIVSYTGQQPLIMKETEYRPRMRANAIDSRALTSFSPATITAGTESILTIFGSGFGAVADTVFFTYASDPNYYAYSIPSQIVSWSNTQVRVKVPDDAGTGTIALSTSSTSGPTMASTTEVSILSAQTNVYSGANAYITRHSNNTNTGKITYTLNSNFNANSAAKSAFQRALRTWRCNSNFNVEVASATTAINVHFDDNVNVITFKNLTGPLGVTYTYFQGCTINGTLYWHLTEMDIEFDEVLSTGTWNFGPGNPTGSQADFESVALHEVGHSILLSHVIDINKVMHRYIVNGTTRRVASADEIAAVVAINARSVANTNMCSNFPLNYAGNISVSNTNDDGIGSLRQAMADVCDNDTIAFVLLQIRPSCLPVQN